MALKNPHKNIPLLFLIGVLLTAYGLGSIYVKQFISPIAAIAGLIGLANILICIVRLRFLSPKTLTRARWQQIGLFCGLIVIWTLLYIEVNYFAHQSQIRWDFTKAKQHTLSDQTKDVIGSLRQDIRITALITGLPPKYLEDLLNEYERQSDGKITAEIIDPLVQIGYASQFGDTINSKEKIVYVQSGKERREVNFTKEALSEEQLTNALVRVTRKVRRVYFLTGHNEYNINDDGETGLKAFEALLASNHAISKRVMLGIQGTIPEDCDVLVIAGARSHLSAAEEKAINDYLEKGGDALFLIENVLVTTPDQPLTKEEIDLNPSLNSILNNWGINVADDVVVDISSHASGDVGSPATNNYMAHRSIVHDLDYTFFIRPRSITIEKGRRPTLKLAPIILTASTKNSWGERNRMLQIKYDEGLDRAGPVPIAFAIWEQKKEDESSDTRIITITDADFLTNAYIGQYSNARLGINAINWLTEVDYQVMFNDRVIKIERLNMTSQQKRAVGVILFIVPVIIATMGLMIWIRRRVA